MKSVDKIMSLHYIRSRDNVSDIFTKACDPETFINLRKYLMGDISNTGKHIHFTFHPLDQSRPRAGECWRVGQISSSSIMPR